MSKMKLRQFGAYLSLAGLLASCSTTMFRGVANEGFQPKTAFEAWGELNHAATSYNARALLVGGEAMDGQTSGVSWGAEKEASSQLITRVMGPPSDEFKTRVSELTPENREKFLKDFLGGYKKNANGYRTFMKDGVKVDLANEVLDADGNQKTIDMTRINELDIDGASLSQLEDVFNDFLTQTENRPLSFLNPKVKSKLFKGKMDGISKNLFGSSYGGKPNYRSWIPNFGKAEKYLSDAHGHGGGRGGGWEINFHPVDTYGEFESMVSWFRHELSQVIKDPRTLEKKLKLFQAPGHQRMVFKKHANLPKEKLAELNKMIQAYIVLKGIQGKTGIEFANYKQVHADSALKNVDGSVGRGVIRYDGERFGRGTFGLEFRAGTKDLNTARFYQTVLAARVSANDFSGLADISDWTLVEASGWSGSAGDNVSASSIASRFDIEENVASKAKSVLSSAGMKEQFQVQFWNWEKAPFIGDAKKKLLKSLTRDYIKKVAALDSSGLSAEAKKSAIRDMNKNWTLATRLAQDVENYMQPKRKFVYRNATHEFKAKASAPNRVSNPVDVNKIDLGIEYSGKFPLAVRGDFSRDRMTDNKRAWIQTKVDLTSEEREAMVKSVATDLHKALRGTEGPVKLEVDGHGHGLDVAYSIRDKQGRKWQVEWDGIGRSYTPDGTIIDDSPRGGSIELITPKFTPKISEIKSVYEAFEKNNILPQLKSGGGHVNIDLGAFDGKPKELARFLSVFHEHRSIIALMFQHVQRTHTSESIEISNNLSQQLKNFNGTETQLKKLLYNEQYFNTRYGRKSRYLQLDMSGYFQDIIPKEFVTDDFDISNPTVQWRRQFRVDPKIRKMEFRMFNAPRDAMESSMQIKLVRAMLDKALNSTTELSGTVQNVTHQEYLADPAKAMAAVEDMCKDLGLNVNEFRPMVSEGLAETEKATRSIFFQDLDTKLANNPPQTGWGRAINRPRGESGALNSTGREWTPGPADELNTQTNEYREQAARDGQRLRQGVTPARELPGEFVRTESCAELIDTIL